MHVYPYTYGHSRDGVPGHGTFLAESDGDAKAQARKLVADGYRNETWIAMDIGGQSYNARNVHGRVVAEING